MDAFLDKVEAVINFWNRIWDKVCDICRPTINFLSPYVMPVLIKIVNELLPLMERPVDWILFWYFACHIPITLFIDLQPIYPEWFIPKFFADVSASYIEILEDPFMDTTKPVKYWFQSFLFCEAFIQLPFFFFATYGVLKNKSWIRLPLAIYGAHVATTVVPILAELVLNQVKYGLSDFQRNCMLVLYVPFFLVPVLAVIDSSIRVTKMIKQNDPTVVKIKETTKTD